jgi:hypothetical protein
MFVTLRLVFPGPLFPSYLSGGGHEDISAHVFGTAELPQEGQLLKWIGFPEQIYIIALRGLGNLVRTRPYQPSPRGAKKPMEMYQAGPGMLFTDKGDCPSILGG